MLVTKTISVFASLILCVQVSVAMAPIVPAKPHVLTIQEKINLYAKEYGVSATVMSNVIKCESSYNPKAVGDSGHSYGLVQIYLPAHLEITKLQALDEDFALEYMAKNIGTNPSQWTCYRNIYE